MSTIEELRERARTWMAASASTTPSKAAEGATYIIDALLAAFEAEHEAREKAAIHLDEWRDDYDVLYESREALLDVVKRLVAHHDAHCAWANTPDVDEAEGPADARALMKKMEGTK